MVTKFTARYIIFAVLSIISINFISCSSSNEEKLIEWIRTAKVMKLSTYGEFDPSSTIESRVGEIPEILLEYLKEIDQKDDYISYLPTDKEMDMFNNSIELLPVLHKKVIQETIIGIYFIEGFLGSGLSWWVLDEDDSLYNIQIYNSEVFKHNISRWLTYRENTAFNKNSSSMRIEIDMGSRIYRIRLYITS